MLTNYINVTASQLFEINVNIFYCNIYYLLEYPNRRNLFTHFSINTLIYMFLHFLFMKHILLFKEQALPYVYWDKFFWFVKIYLVKFSCNFTNLTFSWIVLVIWQFLIKNIIDSIIFYLLCWYFCLDYVFFVSLL